MPLLEMRGCNLAGGDTCWKNWGPNGPVAGKDYQFVSTADIDFCLSRGMNTFRLLFAWEALQPTEYAVLDTLSGNYQAYRDALYSTVNYITSKGANVILDIHDGADDTFATYRGVPVGSNTGSGQKVEDMLANVWGQLAAKFPNVHYGVTNEPHTMSAAQWYTAAQKVINSIRAAGGKGTIYMPGIDWTGAGTWMRNNAGAWNLTDPLNRLAVQVHLYLDPDAGGGTNDIVSPTVGIERTKDLIAWARSKGLKVLFGEVGFSAMSPSANEAWTNLHNYFCTNRDVVAGFCWWAHGPAAWWGGYRFAIRDQNNNETAQWKVICNAFTDPLVALQATLSKITAERDAMKATLQRVRILLVTGTQ